MSGCTAVEVYIHINKNTENKRDIFKGMTDSALAYKSKQ